SCAMHPRPCTREPSRPPELPSRGSRYRSDVATGGTLIDGQRLEDVLVERVRSRFPDLRAEGRGLVPLLAESWHADDDFAEALEFLCRRYLDDLQDEIMEDTAEKWPPTRSGAIPSVDVV